MCYRKTFVLSLSHLLLIVLMCSACKRSNFSSPFCSNGETQCNGNIVERCRDGDFTVWDDCEAQGQVCVIRGTEARCSDGNSIIGVDSDIDMDSDSDSDMDADTDADMDSDTDGDLDSDSYSDSDSYHEDTDDDTETWIPSQWQRENICGCLYKIFDATEELSWMKSGCIDQITDECVFCIDQITHSALCEEMDSRTIKRTMTQCADVCLSALVPPANTNQCEEVIDLYPKQLFHGSIALRDYYGSCMCSNCLPEISACLVDLRCLSPSMCILEIGNNCRGSECLNTGCRDVIQWAVSENPTSLSMIYAVIDCAYRHNSCIPSIDAGLEDGGSTEIPDAGKDAGK
jgi:hypothetical protein